MHFYSDKDETVDYPCSQIPYQGHLNLCSIMNDPEHDP